MLQNIHDLAHGPQMIRAKPEIKFQGVSKSFYIPPDSKEWNKGNAAQYNITATLPRNWTRRKMGGFMVKKENA